MAKTVADPRVLQATNQPNMLQNLQVRNFDSFFSSRNLFFFLKRSPLLRFNTVLISSIRAYLIEI